MFSTELINKALHTGGLFVFLEPHRHIEKIVPIVIGIT